MQLTVWWLGKPLQLENVTDGSNVVTEIKNVYKNVVKNEIKNEVKHVKWSSKNNKTAV